VLTPPAAARRWDATPKVIGIVGAIQLGMVAYAFQAPGISLAIFCEWAQAARAAAACVAARWQRVGGMVCGRHICL
jgi:hypothetical protein